jgi:ABC-type multidrug transport system ATPase subunit
MGIVLDSDGFNGNLTFLENLQFFAKLKGLSNSSLDNIVEKYWSHLSTKENPVKQFSKGERMQCSLARAFLGEPQIILLDEPTINLDFKGVELLKRLVLDSKMRGATTIISSHSFGAISSMCDSFAHLTSEGLKKYSLNEDLEDWIFKLSGDLEKFLAETEFKFTPVDESTLRLLSTNRDDLPKVISDIVESGISLFEVYRESALDRVMEAE